MLYFSFMKISWSKSFLEIYNRFLMGKSYVFLIILVFFYKNLRCGEPNIYMQGFKCKVSNSKSNTPLATPKPAVWCEGAPQNCTRGAKQFIAWNQKTGNNIQVEGYDLEGEHKSPAYNDKCGFSDGELGFLLILFRFLFSNGWK